MPNWEELRDYSELIALAVDHRSQFEDLVAEFSTDADFSPKRSW
ncbi:5-dehydro-2-deoxygluconokinase [Granulibacter bethesdensis]|uniref:5-dehydro-2-deoxygluconokinase n=1 Tax=Granulibacter bethesdensis TaxID=364410 RepID=A0AAC9K6Z8_9PROT|nr:5-dehydro-2-deoxygluconokinase [Granulibacter bethesdensis]APH61961.1 5-dehydro-2-deoxygluconokinase [Granulibacter bethesdensis]